MVFSLVRVTVKHNNTCLVLLRNAKINPLESSRPFLDDSSHYRNSLFFLSIHPLLLLQTGRSELRIGGTEK